MNTPVICTLIVSFDVKYFTSSGKPTLFAGIYGVDISNTLVA